MFICPHIDGGGLAGGVGVSQPPQPSVILSVNLDSVYTGTDPNGSVPLGVQIGLPFTLDLLDPYQFGIAFQSVPVWIRSS